MNARLLCRGLVIIALVALSLLQRDVTLWRAMSSGEVASAQGQSWPDIGGLWSQGSNAYGSQGKPVTIQQTGQTIQVLTEFGDTWTGIFDSPTHVTLTLTSLAVDPSVSGTQARVGDTAGADLTNLSGNCYLRINITYKYPSVWTRNTPPGGCMAAMAAGQTSGQAQVWTVNSAGVKNPPLGYKIGDSIRICFYQPSIGASVLDDHLADGTILSDYYDYGGGIGSACWDDTVQQGTPIGQECMVQTFTDVITGNVSTAQACWQDHN